MKIKFALTVAAAILLAAPAGATQASAKTWNFSVLLDGSRIGYHTFHVTQASGEASVRSEARFDVKFLFFNAFKYRHNNTERWMGDCLVEMDALTNSNGKRFEVSGTRTEYGFVVDANAEASELPECVMTFAYWNPDFLQQRRLLNPQSGEFLDVNVTELGPQQIDVRGEQIDALAYGVTAKKMQLKVWYSEDGEWLALESLAKGGRVIRYELT